MATIVNTPGTTESSGNSGLLIGIVLLIVFGLLFFFYAVPYIGRSGQSSGATQGATQGDNQGSQINVPKDINVNVKQQP